ncbi:ribonuclease P protein component [Sinomonas sp. ASV322]|uniref:ribonuclease P protein component n=1 Tax=Sinomonas sp. ASV322 TaxID=3041920 RepID=UPI0027DE2110|nr:ribonuclease P protein component [Sinomonas sp. ASV322]MDQ4503919.1 ribonuclease P protein component [Sinomonas sp. ASV322]
MLPARNRLRTSVDFSHTVRSGVRQGRRNVVLYAALSDDGAPSRFGFIVSKAVGNAVTRNLVKRRLREAGAETLRERPRGVDVVVRALPAAASADWPSLRSDYVSALRGAVRKLAMGLRQEDVDGSGE